MRPRLGWLCIVVLVPACGSERLASLEQAAAVACNGATTDYSTLVHCHENGGTVETCSDYTPTTNGCGPQASWAGYAAAQVAQGPFPFTTCCDAHDRAYGTCEGGDDLAVGKTKADDDLYTCMTDRCDNSFPFGPFPGAGVWRACCRAAAHVIYDAVDVTQAAQTAYETGQSHACTCQMPPDMATAPADMTAPAAPDMTSPAAPDMTSPAAPDMTSPAAPDMTSPPDLSSPADLSPCNEDAAMAQMALARRVRVHANDTTADLGTSTDDAGDYQCCNPDDPFSCQVAIDFWNQYGSTAQ